jgi:hypothetical protein
VGPLEESADEPPPEIKVPLKEGGVAIDTTATDFSVPGCAIHPESHRREILPDLQSDWRKPTAEGTLALFKECNTSRGLGATHQTGWTALVAVLIEMCADHHHHNET